jgi:sulfite oxidase
VRGHGAVPEVDPAAWRLRVEGLVERALDLSLTTLREAFPERTVTATLPRQPARGPDRDPRHSR